MTLTYTLDTKTLAELEPISSFGASRLQELLEYCHVEAISKGNDLVRLFGLTGKSIYLLDGEIELVYGDGNRMVMSAHSEWAKHPLGKRQPDIVSALSLCDSRLLRIDEELLDRMMTWDQVLQHDQAKVPHPADSRKSGNAVKVNPHRFISSSMSSVDKLNNGPLAHLPAANVSELLRRFEAIPVRAGDAVVREGDDGDYYYIIDNGRAQVTRRVGGVDLLLAELEMGDVFGEEALISGAKRNATVVMKSDGVLLRLGRADFLALLKEPLLHKSSFQHALKAVENGAVWLDVRYPPEYRHDRLRGAMNIPLNEIRDAVGVLNRGKKYIAYCQSGQRSAAAAFILAQAGYDVEVLDGGLWAVPRTAQQ